LLIAVGAVLRFAVSISAHGFNLHTIGVILMIVGGVGVVISLLWMTLWSHRRGGGPGYVGGRGYADRGAPPADTY
jgi:hypothetical protein